MSNEDKLKEIEKKKVELQEKITESKLSFCKDCDPIKNPKCSLCLGS